jgi:hypothetical protein
LSYKRAGLEASRAKGERDHLYIDDADTGVNDRSVFSFTSVNPRVRVTSIA